MPQQSTTASRQALVFHGIVIHSLSISELAILESALLVVSPEGKIVYLESPISPAQIPSILTNLNLSPEACTIRQLARGEFICPGFIDTHNHAPQWTQRGLGRGIPVLTWLQETTFPHEAKFKSVKYARKTYASCVSGLLKQGSTTVAYYGSLHLEATKVLAETCLEKGQRALVGKCNMNRGSPDYYVEESCECSLKETEDFIRFVRELDPQGNKVKPILTPRFAISCTPDLLAGLGEIARRNTDLPVQTHFNEASDEIRVTKQLFPEFENEADLYEHFGLLNERSILAHCIFLTDYEVERLEKIGCGVAHCPVANTTTGTFMAAPILEYLERSIKVGLGTDSGGGFSTSILDVLRQAFIVSNARKMLTDGKNRSLSLAECFGLATLGGAQVCSLQNKVGNFVVGKEFDALLVSTLKDEYVGKMTPIEEEDKTKDIFDKWLMTGDDRNIEKVYVSGVSVK